MSAREGGIRTIRPGDGEWIGRGAVSPSDPVVAGSVGRWVVRYTAGRYGLDDGGALKLSWRFASDWAEPQTADPAAPSYLSATTDSGALLGVRYEPRGNVRPWMKTVLVRVTDGFLAPGQTISIVFDRSRAQTFCENKFQFRLFVDCFGADVYEEVEEDLSFPIVSGPAARLVCVAGTGWAFVRAEDVWGNPSADYRGTVEVGGQRHTFTPSDGGAHRFDGIHTGEGISRVIARDGTFVAESNPVLRSDDRRPFWGDLHGQSGETIGTNTVEDYFRFARDRAGVDFCCHQGNDFQVTPAIWDDIRRQTRAFHERGRFVTFLGVEWSAITAAGGDHNVIYPGDDGELHRSSHWQVDERADAGNDAYPIAELYRAFAGQDVILLPHVGGRRADLRWHDPTLEPLVEIHSCWGTFEWMIDEAMARGHRVGFTAGSDDHKGRPGAAYPGAGQFGVLGGLTCVWARELSRAALWEALRARRTSCSTGERILARLRTVDGRWMGEELDATSAPALELFVAGTRPLEEILVRRGRDAVHRWAPPFEPGDHVRVAWTGARVLDRGRQQPWDGGLRVDGTRILDAANYAIDTPVEGIVDWDADGVRWRSRTAGDEDGVVLRLSDPRRGALRFESPVVSFELPLADLDREWVVEAGGVGRRVVVTRLSDAPAPRDVSLEWRDPSPRSGWNPYYLRVKQSNGSLAWTSPLFVRIL